MTQPERFVAPVVPDIGGIGTWVSVILGVIAFVGFLIRGGKAIGKMEQTQQDVAEMKQKIDAITRTLGLLAGEHKGSSAEIESLRRDVNRLFDGDKKHE